MAGRRRPPSQGWKTFLRNHADGIAAMDLFVVPTIPIAGSCHPSCAPVISGTNPWNQSRAGPYLSAMTQPSTERRNRKMKSLPAVLTALFMAGAAVPVLAQGGGESGIQVRGLETVSNGNGIERGGALLLAHTVRLGLPPALMGDENAPAPRLSIELGYGQSMLPPLGLVSRPNLPEEFRGRADQIGIKANVTMGF